MRVSIPLLMVFICIVSCVSLKGDLKHSGGKDETIHNAIVDFSNRTRLYKNHSVFFVRYYDTLYKPILEKRDDRNYAWINGNPYEGIVAVSISSESGYQFILTSKVQVGSVGILPSRYIEKDGRLFYWWDDNYTLTETGLALLTKYHILQTDSTRSISVFIDDSKKGVHYYFCRSNLSKYERKITNIGIGYDAPTTRICTH